MRAALIREPGSPPVLVQDHPEPQGEIVVDVTAAPLNPVDLSIASGKFYAGPPTTPYVPGTEGVGRTSEGTSVWFETAAGFAGDGSMAERAAIASERAIEVPPGVDDKLAGCFGVAGIAAWVPLAHRAKVADGETVLILGATGVVGQIGVQAAKLLGAGKVIAAGRNLDKLEQLPADELVQLPATAEQLQAAAGGLIDVVLDPLWGEPVAIALEAMNINGRVVQMGQSAGRTATLDSGLIRGRSLQILGHTNATCSREIKESSFKAMCEHAARGELKVEYEEVPLDQVSEAWERQADSPHVKLILVP